MAETSQHHSTITRLSRCLARGFARLIAYGRRRVTVMLIPHSEKPVRSTQLTAISILFFIVLGVTVIVSGIALSIRLDGQYRSIQPDNGQLRNTQANLELARSEILNMLDVFDGYSDLLLSVLDQSSGAESAVMSGDLRSLLEIEETADGASPEFSALRDATELLRLSATPLSQMSGALDLQRQVLDDLPMLWPVINGLGRTAMEFGPNIHPLLNSWYMHKGIDIAYFNGTPVVATGNGVVTDAGFDAVSGYGGFVEIQHLYGFTTKYTHLASVDVEEGRVVRQGDTIGLLGNTGLSTGPHVHYEITIGTEVIDPAPFLKTSRPNFTRRTQNRR